MAAGWAIGRLAWLACGWVGFAPAAWPAAAPREPAIDCMRAAAAAEARWNLPRDLLAAIGRVESGQADPATGTVLPWPYVADVAGSDYVFATAAQAEAVVELLRAHGVASIDVGCFQVNLMYHPTAFDAPARGFDPDANADYAGRLLRALHDRAGSWGAAIAAYHSGDPGRGAPYRDRVLRVWFGLHAGAPIPVYTARTLPPRLRAALAWRGRPVELSDK